MRGYTLAGEHEPFSVKQILKAIRSVLPACRPIAHHEPHINGKEAAYVRECLDKGLVGYEYVNRFEVELARRCGVAYCVATSSGTAALHVALLSVGVKPDDEVLVPSLTFAATANAVSYVGAIPNFIDGALGVNTYKLSKYLERETEPAPDKRGRLNKRTGRRISVIIPVHLLGSAVDMPRLLEIAKAFGLEIIEDAAEALGSFSGNSPCGSQGLCGILSFNNNKIVTTNGGGAILTNDEWIAAKCRQLVSTARVPHPWLVEHDAVGYNYAMGNINAALGLAQLEQLDTFLQKKQSLADGYRRACADTRGIQFLDPSAGSNNWLNGIVVDPRWDGGRDELLEVLHKDGILARALFTPLHTLKHFVECPRDDNLLYSEDLWKRTICLPSGVAHDLQAT